MAELVKVILIDYHATKFPKLCGYCTLPIGLPYAALVTFPNFNDHLMQNEECLVVL